MNIFKDLENPARPILGPNIWILKKAGLILPESVKGKAIYLLIYEVITLFTVSIFMELYVIRSDMQEVLRNLQFCTFSTVMVAKAHTILLRQDSWKKVMDYVIEADKFERENKDEVRGEIIDKYTRQCRRVTYFYWFMTIMTNKTIVFVNPLMRFLSYTEYERNLILGGNQDGLRNHTVPFPHIYSAWVPIEKEHPPGCWITFTWHATVSCFGATIISAYDSTVIVIMMFFAAKLELLRKRCERMMGSLGEGISEEEADREIGQMHRMHALLIENTKLFNSLTSPVMFLYVVVCSLMLCASAFQITSATDAMQKFLTAQYLLFGIFQLFICCWSSHNVFQKSQNVSLGPYESEWWAASARQRKALQLLTGQLRITHVFTAGPFTDLTLPTFVTILKGAYSYYTLLRK